MLLDQMAERSRSEDGGRVGRSAFGCYVAEYPLVFVHTCVCACMCGKSTSNIF